MKHHLTIMTGASRGLGLALARQLLVPGATLVCISRHTSDPLAQAATKQRAALEQWTLDLAHCVQVANALKAWLQSKNEGQWLSATLINNAGVIPAVAPLRQRRPQRPVQRIARRPGGPHAVVSRLCRSHGGLGIHARC